MSQYQLARIAGLSESWISHFETGKRKPSVGNLIKLADALGVSADYLLGRPMNRNILRESE
jgi:transcriptional regulator with XRE-family HTH domain